MILDICLAYRSRDKTRNLLVEKASANGLDLKELEKLVEEISKSPPGISGLARATMALTVIMVLAIAVIHIMVAGCQADDSKIISNILSMLGGLLAAITGFYFGGKAVEKAVEEERKNPVGARPNNGVNPPGGGANAANP
jgi:hypothetical protein